MFSTHNWPGNVRELRNVVERSLIVCDKDLIEERHLPVLEQREVSPSSNSVAIPVGTTVAEAEKQLIYKTLEFTENNKTRAAEILGVSLKTPTTSSTFATLRLKTKLTLITTLVRLFSDCLAVHHHVHSGTNSRYI
jgi:transcriptional regulator with PAS, ATPase and Fis domain